MSVSLMSKREANHKKAKRELNLTMKQSTALVNIDINGFLYVEEAISEIGARTINSLVKRGLLEYDHDIGRYLISDTFDGYLEGYIYNIK